MNDGNLREWVYSARGIQGNAVECRGTPGERMVLCAKCQGNTGESQGNLWEWVQCQGNAGVYRGIRGEHMGVGVNCQGNAGNAEECQGNVWEWVYNARRMQGTTRGMQGSGCKVLAE